jgi:hypothetical protein
LDEGFGLPKHIPRGPRGGDHDHIVFDANELTPDCFSTLTLAIDHGSSAPMVALLLGRTREDLRLNRGSALVRG